MDQHRELVDRVQSILDYEFRDLSLVVLALTHASIAPVRFSSNERLEFLGDSVLALVACETIYRHYPELLEGEMTKIKSVAVSRKVCAKIASRIGLDELIILGKGIREQQGTLPHSLAAATLESVIGALYLDGGLEPVRRWLGPLIEPHILAAAESGHQQNFKSVLQQHAQRSYQSTPQYVIVSQAGPDHAKTFRVAARLGTDTFEPAEGASKKQAEQRAALNALAGLGLIEHTPDGSVRLVRGAYEPEES